MPVIINGDTGITQPNEFDSDSSFGFKNRLINGGMVIDQRNNGVSVTANNAYTLDRWINYSSQTSKFTVQRNAGSVTPPAGFSNYLGVTSTSAYAVNSTDFFTIEQPIEGFNAADLSWGTANAQPVTLSFWVRSSLTGTFGGAFYAGTGSLGYAFSYTISSANTWEYKTVAITGPTTGTWASNNTAFGTLCFSLGMGSSYVWAPNSWLAQTVRAATGSTSVVGTNGATFYITGVQLEKGSTATSFDFRSIGTELQLCQRYYESLYTANSTMSSVSGFIALGVAESTSRVQPYYPFKVQKRASPSTTLSAISTFGMRSAGGSSVVCTSGAFGAPSNTYAQGEFNCGSNPMTSGGCGWLTNHDGNAKIEWSAEL